VCSDDPSLLEPVGVYLVEPRTLGLIQPVGFQDFKEQFLPKVIAAGMTIRSHTIQGSATLIHSPSHYIHAMGAAIGRAWGNLPPGYTQRGPGVVVHHSATIHPTARITGPAWIDENAVVEEHSVLAGPVLLAPGARVEGHALLHDAVVMQHATVGVAAELISTILAPNVTHCAEPARTETFAPIQPPTPRFAAPLWDRVDRFFALFGTPRSA
jgi:mannose-1-phosphate guanylyltransferase/phosphomannomutase